MSLEQADCGEWVTIVALHLPENSLKRLSAVGIFPGSLLRVIDNALSGVTRVECRGTRLALGRELPKRIEIQQLF